MGQRWPSSLVKIDQVDIFCEKIIGTIDFQGFIQVDQDLPVACKFMKMLKKIKRGWIFDSWVEVLISQGWHRQVRSYDRSRVT